jgi:hypothetical protein
MAGIIHAAGNAVEAFTIYGQDLRAGLRGFTNPPKRIRSLKS